MVDSLAAMSNKILVQIQYENYEEIVHTLLGYLR